MAKFLKQPEKKRKRRNLRLAVGMILYAVVFLALTAVGLNLFWDYIEAYELSRNSIAIESYMETVTEDYLCGQASELIATIDHNIQSEEECRQAIRDALAEGVRYARKSAECTQTREVYVLRTGKQVIGQFVITAQEPDEYGFTPWEVTEESFDFSYLVGQTVSITVPEEYPVYVNGTRLDSSYVVESGLEYSALEEFYDDFELPTMVTYTAGPFLGDYPMEVTDPEGNAVTIGADTDMNQFLHNCTEEEQAELEAFLTEFIKRYVAFAGNASGGYLTNYHKLMEYVVKGSDLQTRMYDALEGLAYTTSQRDDITSLQINHIIRIAEGTYICDATYEVDTVKTHGSMQTVNNIKVVAVMTDNGLKANAMTTY